MLKAIPRLFRSASVRAALTFAVGGLGFSLATLLLARFMSPQDFGVLALLLALIQLGIAVGPAGVDLVVNRRRLPSEWRLACRVGLTSALAAVAITALAGSIYDVPAGLLPWLWLALTGSGLSRVGSALFQSGERFFPALALNQGHNYILLLAVPLALAFDALGPGFFLVVVASGYVITSAWGWLGARRVLPASREPVAERVLLREGLSGVGIGAAVLILAQTERFVIPLLLSYEEMAVFGVLAAVVVAPFRMMQLAVGFTMLPRLRGVDDGRQARRLIHAELGIAALIAVAGGAAVMLLGPWVIQVIVGDKYDIPLVLFAAAVAVGWVRLGQAIAVATVNALGSTNVLAVLNLVCWLSLVLAVAAAWLLRDLGLVGVILGVGFGWLCQALVAVRLAMKAFAGHFGSAREPSR